MCTSIWGSGINNNTIYVILSVRASEALASKTTPFTSYWVYEQLRLWHQQQQHHLRHTECTSIWGSGINNNTISRILSVRASEALASTTTTPFTSYWVYEHLRLWHQQQHHFTHTECTSIWGSGIKNNTIYFILCVRATESLASTKTPFTSYCVYEQLSLWHQQQHLLRHTVCTSIWVSGINKNTFYGIPCVRATEALASKTTPFTAYCVYEQLRLWHQQHHLRHIVCKSNWVSGINNNIFYDILCVRATEALAATTTPFTSYCVYEHLRLWHHQQHHLRHTVWMSNWGSGINNNTIYVILCVRASEALASTTTPFTAYCVYEQLRLWHQQQHHLRHTVCTSNWGSVINTIYGILCVRASEALASTTTSFTAYCVYEQLGLWYKNCTIYDILCVRATEALVSTTTPFTAYCVYEQLRLWYQQQHLLRHTVCTSNWGSGINNSNTIYGILCVRATETLAKQRGQLHVASSGLSMASYLTSSKMTTNISFKSSHFVYI